MLKRANLAETAAALRDGRLDVLAHARATLARLAGSEPQLCAFLPESGRAERVLAAARTALARWPQPEERPPLFGVPVAIKDIIRVDGLPTRGGSALPPMLFEGAQAACVNVLECAGALVLGKSVTTEFACFEPGPTRNPHNLAHTPGGSSSGAAAAVAAGLCPLALGTQTIGSVIRPAAYCGVVGFKPGHGRIDAAGILFVARSLDTVGLFAQDVAGARLAASLLCRGWEAEALRADSPPRLGVPEGSWLARAEPAGLSAFEAQLQRLKAAGYEIRRVPALQNIDEIERRHHQLMTFEMAREHRQRFTRYEARYRPRTAQLIRRGQAVSAQDAAAARERITLTRRELEAQMDDAGIDIWLGPAAPGPAPRGIASTGDPAMNLPWTQAGMPTLTLPAGYAANGLPLGLQCSARQGADEHLLAWAEGLEAVLAA